MEFSKTSTGFLLAIHITLNLLAKFVATEDSYSYLKFNGPVSGPIREYLIPGRNEIDYVAKPDYSYSYGVQDPKSGNSQVHKESRDGDEVKGEYRVLQADGSVFLLVLLLPLAAGLPVEYGGELLFRGHGALIKAHKVAYPKYHFEYGVNDSHTGDIKVHKEERDGDSVKGEYSFLESDGTFRRVQYHDDGYSGFKALVIKTGQAHHPAIALKSLEQH